VWHTVVLICVLCRLEIFLRNSRAVAYVWLSSVFQSGLSVACWCENAAAATAVIIRSCPSWQQPSRPVAVLQRCVYKLVVIVQCAYCLVPLISNLWTFHGVVFAYDVYIHGAWYLMHQVSSGDGMMWQTISTNWTGYLLFSNQAYQLLYYMHPFIDETSWHFLWFKHMNLSDASLSEAHWCAEFIDCMTMPTSIALPWATIVLLCFNVPVDCNSLYTCPHKENRWGYMYQIWQFIEHNVWMMLFFHSFDSNVTNDWINLLLVTKLTLRCKPSIADDRCQLLMLLLWRRLLVSE